jgi:hypothetical protein
MAENIKDKAKRLREEASGKETKIYKKPTKPAKDVNSSDYNGMTEKQKNTPAYESKSDADTGKKAQALKELKRVKEEKVTKKEAYNATENPKAKGSDYNKVTYSKVDSTAYDRVMRRAQASGLSESESKKAIKDAIVTVSANLQTDRNRTAGRAELHAALAKKKKENKLS